MLAAKCELPFPPTMALLEVVVGRFGEMGGYPSLDARWILTVVNGTVEEDEVSSDINEGEEEVNSDRCFAFGETNKPLSLNSVRVFSKR